MTIVRTGRALVAMWGAEIAAASNYRANLLLEVVVQTLWFGFSVAPVLVVFGQVQETQGWTAGQVVVLQAIWYALDAVVWLWLIPNLAQLSESVRSGQLDMALLKPVDSLLYVSLGRIAPQDLIKVALSLLVGVVALVLGDPPGSILHLTAGVVALGCGAVVLWAFGVIVHAKALTSVRFDAGFLLHSVHNLARVPVPFYGQVLRVVLTVVVPVAFLATVPAELLFARTSWWWLAAAMGVAVGFTAVARGVWGHQIRRYTGAMA